MQGLRDAIGNLAGILIGLLEVIGAALALLAVVLLAAVILRSVGRAVWGRATLVLPFRGADKAGLCLNEILAQQLGEIETAWQGLSRQVREAQAAAKAGNMAMLVDLGRSEPDAFLDSQQELLILSDPMEGQAIGAIGFGSFSFSPDSLFALSYKTRTLLARRTIRGGIDQVGDTVRLSTTLTTDRDGPTTMVLVRSIERPDQLLELVDDMAFEIVKRRWGLSSEAKTWRGYRAFMQGYTHHIRYIRTGNTAEREAAIDKYRQSVTIEPGYALAHYNLGTLLYNRFTATDNDRAIEHLRKAAEASEATLKALSLGVLSRAYCQQVHRYGHEKMPWMAWAEEASAMAVQLGPDLEETWLAHGFALQFLGKPREAIEAYWRVMALPGDSPEELRLKSSAENNRAYIAMTEFNDLKEAEVLFKHALALDPHNKFCYANLGEIYKRQNNYSAALVAFEQAVRLDPRYTNGTNELGMLYIAIAADARDSGKQKEMAEALQTAAHWHERALSIVPEEEARHRAEIRKRFAKAYREKGFHQEAEWVATPGDGKHFARQNGD
ncbi:tetratricopeptide repeat protein [Candidatus Manganitrophus noduliformans]|uniref:Tetratricopeptide repeat protein n=1 Tax=Candidatus Manganitrophus noduliformans TaxID=2606439 RepID=A0A7X6IA29_9BACT|nr:tetratricopeptide repeat protein [Candidatus Manganitrophus noduliformans]NKE69970.1 tetratricopeptide repeat protein [Candidatus Manganitrophus noduliformans]